MKQTLHIFAKDARHFLAEILISLALVAAFVRVYPSIWQNRYGVVVGEGLPALFASPILAMILVLLLPVSWWLLIARVIHAEPLVGDRQFWATRPYEWKKLLGAKLLFLVVFLYLPLLAAQCLLLVQAGFHPLSYFPGLLYNLLLLTGAVVLPLFAITTVTATFARLTITLLALLALFIGYISISLIVWNNAGFPYNEHLSIPLSLGFCAAVVLVQYATRRLRISLLLLIALPVLLVLTGLSFPQPERIEQDYAGTGAPLHLSLLQDESDPPTANLLPNKTVQVTLPLQTSGVAEGHAILPDQVRMTIDAGPGRRWTSLWQAINNEHYLPGLGSSYLNVVVDHAFFDQVKSSTVALQITLAFTEVEAGKTFTLPLSAQNSAVPGFGICSPHQEEFHDRFFGIGCRFALHMPALTRISVLWPESPCSSSQAMPPTVVGDAWLGSLEHSVATLSIPAVWSADIPLSNSIKQKGAKGEARHLCPGTPMSFTPYHLARRAHYDLTLPDFQLPSYEHEEARLRPAR